MNTANRFNSFVRTYFAIGAAISLFAMVQTQIQTEALLKLRTRYKWVLLMALFALNIVVGVYIAARGPRSIPSLRFPAPGLSKRSISLSTALVLVVSPAVVFMIARGDFFGSGSAAFFRLLWLFWWLALAQAAGLRLAGIRDWPQAMAVAMLMDGLAAQLFTLSAAVSTYPFSIGWSEASRYYYGSLIFAKALYGEVLPLSVMHGSRYLLQSVPFLLGAGTLWVSRLWQVILWIALSLTSAWAVTRRLGLRDRTSFALGVAWLFLFYFQGAVYYHLQVCVIVVMLGVSMKHPARSVAAVALASFWAGMSRVNWFPVPAMLAIGLYLLEAPYGGAGGLFRYVRVPVFWGLAGLLSAFGGQAFYVAISCNTNLEAFASSFTSALLWYRWWPSATNPIGIIPGMIVVSAPVWALIAWRVWVEPRAIHWLRLLGLGALFAMLMAGGLVVSTKIGGGGDLHNLDAYLVLLGCVGAYAWVGKAALEAPRASNRPLAPVPIGMLVVLVPVTFALLRLGGRFAYDPVRANAELTALGREVQRYGASGEVLFMYERHLQAFDMVPAVKIVPQYEVLTLMEMAISGNRQYLMQFYDDLQRHRFAAIVAHPQNLGVETGDFIEENDAWNQWVAQPLLCQYKPALTLEYSKIQILVPRDRPCPDFPPKFDQP